MIRERCNVLSPQEGVGSAREIWGVEAREGEHLAVDMQVPWRCGGGWKCRVFYCKVCLSACTERTAEAQKELRR